jgi:PAS domain S-box-containing protein
MAQLRFLLLEDSLLDVELVQLQLNEGNFDYELVHVETKPEFLRVLQQTCKFDLILSDYLLPEFDGISALEIASQHCPEVPFIFVSATLGEELAIEALKNGATDYVLKQRLTRLVPSVDRALREANHRQKRQEAETALQESEARFKRLMQANLIGCMFWHEDGKVLDANDAFLQMVGYSRADLNAGQINWRSMTSTSQLDLSERSIAQMKQTGSADPLEKDYIRKDGSTIPVLLGGVMFENSTDQGVSYVVDLSDRKRAEQELKTQNQRLTLLSEQLAQANSIKDEFLAILSHELRTPLNPILGWTNILKSRPQTADLTAQALDAIERNAKIQIQLIDDLLDISRILRGKLSLEREPVDLRSVIHAAMQTMQLAAEAKEINLQLIDPNPISRPIHILGDASRLQQILWNLLSNAIKFTAQGGRVEIVLEVGSGGVGEMRSGGDEEMRGREVGEMRGRGDEAHIVVRDNGKGISPSFLPHLFEYFRQEDSGSTRKFGGLGLGLAIVHHLVEQHGGTVQAASAGEHQGATFTVRFPLLKPTPTHTDPAALVEQPAQQPDEPSFTPPRSSSQPHPAQPLHQLQILVVDDDPDSQSFVGFLLEDAGATVRLANSAREALSILVESPLDLMLSDIGMPEMDGYRLMEQIQVQGIRSKQGLPLPAIALTAYAGEFDQQQVISVGFQRHLAKPVNPDDLINAVIELVLQQSTL